MTAFQHAEKLIQLAVVRYSGHEDVIAYLEWRKTAKDAELELDRVHNAIQALVAERWLDDPGQPLDRRFPYLQDKMIEINRQIIYWKHDKPDS